MSSFILYPSSFYRRIACIIGTLALGLGAIHAQEPLKIELVSEVTSIQPGKPFYVGLHLQHKEGYHTYWKFPGIVGVPTNVAWDLPRGWKAEAIEWPEPERVFMFKIRAQGYEGEVILPVRITPPEKLVEGSTVTLTGKASWMCCNRECNPGFKDLVLSLPVSDKTPILDKEWTKLFAQAKASQPQAITGWETIAVIEGSSIKLRLVPQTEALKKHAADIKDLFFFTEDGLVDPDKEQVVKHGSDGSLVLEMFVSEYAPKRIPKSLIGVLQSHEGLSVGGIKSASFTKPLVKEN